MSETSNREKLNELTITELMAKLDDIVNWFSGDSIDVDQAGAKFDEGMVIAEAIKGKLSNTENKVNQIKLKLEKLQDRLMVNCDYE